MYELKHTRRSNECMLYILHNLKVIFNVVKHFFPKAMPKERKSFPLQGILLLNTNIVVGYTYFNMGTQCYLHHVKHEGQT